MNYVVDEGPTILWKCNNKVVITIIIVVAVIVIINMKYYLYKNRFSMVQILFDVQETVIACISNSFLEVYRRYV